MPGYQRCHRCALCKEIIHRKDIVYRFVASGQQRLAPAHQHCLDRLRAKVGPANVWLRRLRYRCWCCDKTIERHEAVTEVYDRADTHYRYPHRAHAGCAYDEAMCR